MAATYETRMRLVSQTPNITTNTSKVVIAFDFRRTDRYYYGYNNTGSAYFVIACDGQSSGNVSVKFNFNDGSAGIWHEIGRYSFTVNHNADGTKRIWCNAVWVTNISSPTQLEGSNTFTLESIARASTVSFSDNPVDIGEEVTITTNRASSSFTHSIEYSCGTALGTIAENVGDSYTWTVPDSLLSQIPNTVSATVTVTCKTYNGTTLIGTKTSLLTVNVPASLVPQFTYTVSESEERESFIQSISKLLVSITAEVPDGTTIASYMTVFEGDSYTEDSFTTNSIQGSGSRTLVISVTDARGRVSTATEILTVLPYEAPKLSQFTAERCTQGGTLDSEGHYLLYSLGWEYSTSASPYQTRIYVKEEEAEVWTLVDTFTEKEYVGTYKTTSEYVTPGDRYKTKIELSDSFYSISNEIDIDAGYALINVKPNGRGIGFGTASDEDCMKINMPVKFKFNGSYYELVPFDPCPYAVGDLYWTTSDVIPSEKWENTEWEQIKDVFVLAAGDIYEAGDTGGEAEHMLTVDEIPEHRHKQNSTPSFMSNRTMAAGSFTLADAQASNINTDSTGGGLAHNNMPPYMTAYCWKRTA